MLSLLLFSHALSLCFFFLNNQGKNLQFSGVNRYNNSLRPAASSYYITLEAKDPTIGLVQTFQTTVSEVSFGELILSCKVARPYGK